ncbi:MAG: hypothetical protein KZQ86_08230, partial [Candidatus Thiodiazotropha sp. (ex Lucinoma kastoroae)]|nr:hypothetical protein [Candidatus Thiodiazotropha sp. (ex Lucinoma kastoroae)]
YTYAPDSHQLLQILGSITDTRHYDEVGNTLSDQSGNFDYDDSNRLIRFSNTDTLAEYAYNGKGERISKTVNGITTRFRYGPDGQLLGEYDQAGQMIREYTYLEGQPIALVSPQSEASGIAFDQSPVLSYGGTGQDVSATIDIEGANLTLTGNGWKKIALPYSVTPDTVLEFDFASDAQGEIHGIGFDTDNGISPNQSFNLYGSQSWGILDFATYNGSGIMHYRIPVGSYFTGAMQWLTFINDHDISNPTGESWFSNIRVYEAGESDTTSVGLAYLHTDHLGTVVKATDENQAIIWDAVRKPFGERLVTMAQIEMPLGFPGQYYDQETGLHYNYFRDYDPTTGRYLQSDPIGLRGGMNTYVYVGGNPVLLIDPKGLAGFFGAEMMGGYGLGLGGGIIYMTCKEECEESHTYIYMKVCGGLTTPGIAGSVTGGPVSNMDGKQCRPNNYSGYFGEANANAFGVGVGVDVGLSDVDGNFIPDGVSGVNEAGVGYGTGLPGMSAMLCYYIYIGEK